MLPPVAIVGGLPRSPSAAALTPRQGIWSPLTTAVTVRPSACCLKENSGRSWLRLCTPAACAAARSRAAATAGLCLARGKGRAAGDPARRLRDRPNRWRQVDADRRTYFRTLQALAPLPGRVW